MASFLLTGRRLAATMTKVLILSAGRRRYVAEALLKAKLDSDELLAADVEPLLPGLRVPGITPLVEPADAAEADRWLLNTCERLEVNAVLSLHDYQIGRVSRLGDHLGALGCVWIGPAAETADVLLDKKRLANYLTGCAPTLAVPTFAADEFPGGESATWVLKERLGSGSSGLQIGVDSDTARRALVDASLVAQPCLTGEEWNLDFFVWPGQVINGLSAKRKIRMRAGETDAAEVIPSVELSTDLRPVVEALSDLHHLGNMDVDIMVGPDGVRVLDVNPRFGGGYAFSLMAGYPAAEAVWQVARGEGQPFQVEARSRFLGAKSIEVVAL
ncbi:MAG: ATP-grasp domain-containing protein [Nocardioides sp.]|nr:ATP-grasp domain-containing protein [Nocardioides sp.]